MGSSRSWAAKMCMDAVSPIDTSSEPYEFVSESLRQTVERSESEGIRGTRSRHGERVSQGLKRVGGSITMNPTPTELDRLLPRILGAAESSDSFALAETLPEFLVCIDRIAKVHTYAGCKVSRATFAGSAGQKVTLTLDIVGKTETEGNAGTFPSVTIDLEDVYMFFQGVLTLNSTATAFESFSLVIDNVLDAQFRNSQTATDITPSDRIVELTVTVPYTSAESALYTTPSTGGVGLTGIAGVLEFTNGSNELTFTLNSLKPQSQTPVVNNRTGEIQQQITYRAYQTSTTKEIVVGNVNAA